MATLTIAEEEVLQQFRNRVNDVLKTKEHQSSTFLIKWLRARDLDLNKAEQMLRSSLIWREENNVDQILEIQFDSFWQTEYPYYISGRDKFSNPVLFVPIGKWDLRKLANLGKTEEFKLYVNFIFETLCKTIRAHNEESSKTVSQFSTIMDWKGYSYMQLCSLKAVQSILYAGGIYEAHYPEVLCKCFFVNTPSFFGVLLQMIKNLLAEKTYKKISVHGYNEQEWKAACNEFFGEKELATILEPLKGAES